MRTVPPVCISYRLDFASGAWSELGLVEREDFRRLTEKLREVAAEAPRLAGAPGDEPAPHDRTRVECGEYAALYEVDHLTCTVLVVKLVRAGSPVAATS